MIEYFFFTQLDQDLIKNNYLSTFIEEEACRFYAEGYSKHPSRQKLRGMSYFGNWLQKNDVPISKISLTHAEQYFAARKTCKSVQSVTFRRQRAAVNHIVKAIKKQFPPPKTMIEMEIEEYIDHLHMNRGLSDSNFRHYRKHLSNFLRYFFPENEILINSLCPLQLREYFTNLTKTISTSNLRMACITLKLYFNFLEYRGLPTQRFFAAFPSISNLQTSLSPEVITGNDLSQLLASLNLTTSIGKRGYAAILCMYDLGIRVSDVSNMQLDDIDWINGTIRIGNQKTGAGFYLPLPKRVGESLVDYIMHGRPKTKNRNIFLNCQAHRETQPASPTAIQIQVKRLWRKAGLNEKYSGTHIFRHSKATQLRCQGIPIKIIADILGHKRIDSTQLYAQVDIPTLREVAQPWPM